MRRRAAATIVLSAVVAATVSYGWVSAIAIGYFGEPIGGSSADWEAFTLGLRQFSRVWLIDDGAGPEFNGRSCMACHAVPMPGGAGLAKSTFVLVSAQIHDEAGGNVFQRLQRTPGGIVSRTPPDALRQRKAPSLFGLGLLEAIPVEQLLQPMPGPDQINGRPGGMDIRFGRFGWKAGIPDLEEFVRRAFAIELGFGLKASRGLSDPSLEYAIGQVTSFVRMLAPPPSKRSMTEIELTGERLFGQIGCAQCHRPSLSATYLQGSTVLHEQINAYTDLLLHDMGTVLADGIKQGKAGESDFRTAPLWGLTSSGPPYLHDGRANDLVQAIDQHNGEARNSRLRWQTLSGEERGALLHFLRML